MLSLMLVDNVMLMDWLIWFSFSMVMQRFVKLLLVFLNFFGIMRLNNFRLFIFGIRFIGKCSSWF